MIRALFFDVDGTLLSFRTHAIPASTREAIDRARQRGVRLFIATGRAVCDLSPLADIPYDGVVGLNGADCRLRDGRVVANRPIPREAFERAMALSRELDFPMGLELDEGIFVNRVTPVVRELAELIDHPVPEVTDLAALFDRVTCCQMCFYLDAALERRVMSRLPGLVSSRWCPIFVDVNLGGVDKAVGVKEMAAHFGLSLDETMAFGDGGNDAGMLRAAGIGVAMGNACEEALAAADYTTTSVDDDGILRALEHFGVI